jgi:hypothetical protein
MTARGSPNLCSAQCTVGMGQSWQELGECLSKRVEVVVCKPADAEVGNGTQATPSRSATGSVTLSTGAASAVGVGHVGGSKAGVVVFAVLAIGSFAGMLM